MLSPKVNLTLGYNKMEYLDIEKFFAGFMCILTTFIGLVFGMVLYSYFEIIQIVNAVNTTQDTLVLNNTLLEIYDLEPLLNFTRSA